LPSDGGLCAARFVLPRSAPGCCQIGLKWFLSFFCHYRSNMDSFDRQILTSLKNGESLDFRQLLQEVGFSHNTLRLHIAKLKRQGMIVQTEKTGNSPGRPVLIYSLPPEIKQRVALTLTDPYTTIVSLNFQKLKHLCRFEKGGYCKETRRNCGAQNCPQIIKGE
jgi:predicted transcriptional regulator